MFKFKKITIFPPRIYGTNKNRIYQISKDYKMSIIKIKVHNLNSADQI